MKRVLVIGSGIIGLCSAHYLRGRGFEVTVIDRCGPDDQGCSFGNAGMVVPSHFVPLAAPGMVATALKMMLSDKSPFYIHPRLDVDLLAWMWHFWRSANPAHVARAAPILRDLHLASRACYEELAQQEDFGLVKRGLLMFCRTQHALEEEGRAAMLAGELGIPARVLTPGQAQTLDPALELSIAGAVYYPKDCHLDPTRLVLGLRRRLEQAGVEFLWNRPAIALRASGRRIDGAVGGGQVIAADEYVLCAGAWSAQLAQPLGLNLPLQGGKGYSLTLSNPPALPSICSILCEARVAVTPMSNTLRIGGTMEMAGLDTSISPQRVQGIIQAVPGYFPQFNPTHFQGIRPWSGLRPCSPDGLPYLGRTGRYDNLIVATGHAMMGMSLGPATGSLIAQIAGGDSPSIDLSLLCPDRFGPLMPQRTPATPFQ